MPLNYLDHYVKKTVKSAIFGFRENNNSVTRDI